VVENCREAAKCTPGLFTLTVPTGGGKTLSSLSFALRHALTHGQHRVVYVAPFTSIIEQNAEVIRNIVSPLASENFDPLIEHHSALDPAKENTLSRLAAENWDAPLIITTAVQFYESLFAAKTSRCRKLHNIANSVIILDEAQSLPVDFLAPCLRTLQELCDHYCATVVLCTATQPAIHHSDDFTIGLKGCREIIKDTDSLFQALKRVQTTPLGDIPDAKLTEKLVSHHQALCIVNRRNHAQKIYRALGRSEANFHLSALMCPEHRSQTLTKIRSRLAEGLPTRVISTQLIEAGVDLDFPVVYRALAGLDSIAQAAGRCNRHGRCQSPGQTFIFRPEDQSGETHFRETAQVAHQLLDLHEDLLTPTAVQHYFDLYYYQQKTRWDSKRILDGFHLDQNPDFPFRFQFSEIARNFRLIDDWQVPLIIPFDERARTAIEQLRNPSIPLHRTLLRKLQRYTVQIPPRLRDDNIKSIESLRDGQFHALISTDLHYSTDFGLTFDVSHSSHQQLIC
jgi:CRISPR-associated endonuclease/helicase Cas3